MRAENLLECSKEKNKLGFTPRLSAGKLAYEVGGVHPPEARKSRQKANILGNY
jgi:hypothetical protein